MTIKKKKNFVFPIFTLTLIVTGILGATLFTPKLADTLSNLLSFNTKDQKESRIDGPSKVLPLLNLDSALRKSKLEAIANEKEDSLDRNRARYLLATELLAELKGGEALAYLEGLEKDYSILAPEIILRIGRAYELTNDTKKAQEIWQKLIEQYPNSFVSADALFKLGKYDQKYWQDAIKLFPTHPRTHDIAYELLKKNPKQLNLLLLLAKYDPSHRSSQILDTLSIDYEKTLKPEEWQIVADSFWRKEFYEKASKAYEKAPSTSQNLYRLARGYHVSDQKKKAISGYEKLISTFPDAKETGLGLRRLASLSTSDKALSYLNQVITKFPKETALALVQKASLLTDLGRNQEAQQTRQIIMTNYSDSDEAATYRWQIAKNAANSGNYATAWQWAAEIAEKNPNSDITPKAIFWMGKWAEYSGQPSQAIQAYQLVIDNYPQSYYAWRGAVKLGWDVGDFNTVRSLTPDVVKPQVRLLPPVGSMAFKELFLLQQDEDVIDLFTAEMGNKEELTVSEQFTKGLLEQIQGNYLEGINLIWSLKKKDAPQDQEEWQILRKSPEYWQTLFPFPFEEIILKWSQERQINPLLVTGLMRQESRFQPKIKSPVGATGLMQIMPDTGKFIAAQIQLKDYDLTNPDDNIKLGTWYLDHTHETYNGNSMLAVASYNAGPGNVSKWVEKYNMNDVDEFVENIPFRETKGYVENVFGNYWNYLRIYNPEISKKLIMSR